MPEGDKGPISGASPGARESAFAKVTAPSAQKRTSTLYPPLNGRRNLARTMEVINNAGIENWKDRGRNTEEAPVSTGAPSTGDCSGAWSGTWACHFRGYTLIRRSKPKLPEDRVRNRFRRLWHFCK